MKPGLYEQIINKQMNEELQSVPEECRHQEKVDSAEASRVLATYAAELMKRKEELRTFTAHGGCLRVICTSSGGSIPAATR